MKRMILVILFVAMSRVSQADETNSGHLVIIGGGLLPDNNAVYERLVKHAGGLEKARFGIFPTAGTSIGGGERFARNLIRHGVPKKNIQIINLTVSNADQQSSNPEIIEQIERCTGIFFTGGDQRRITSALFKADGTDTRALQAIRSVFKRGGLFAGSSAGAAVQADPMITVSGLPDDSLDEGMDALDFGRTSEPSRRGVLISRGLGFFRGGLVDQHFSQYRGRLGRLARVAIEERIRFGFGIDENTALDVAPNGTVEVVGAGHVTIVDTAEAKCQDGPLGCRIDDVRLNLLASGDRFDPRSGIPSVHPGKTPILEGKEENNGNYPIPDIAAPLAVLHALIEGLGNNTSRTQVGFTLKYNQHHSHGYRFMFSETPETRTYEGDVNDVFSYAVVGAKLKIEPVVLPFGLPPAKLAIDLPEGPPDKSIESMIFRGILLTDEQHRFRPNDPIVRADLANAIAQTIHLEPPRKNPPRIADVTPESLIAEEIGLVVGSNLMETDSRGAFLGANSVTRSEAAKTFVRLAEMFGTKRLPVEPVKLADESMLTDASRNWVFSAIQLGLLKVDGEKFRPNDALTRQEAATAICRVIGFPWQENEE